METMTTNYPSLTPEEKWEQATLANNMSSFKSPDGLLKLSKFTSKTVSNEVFESKLKSNRLFNLLIYILQGDEKSSGCMQTASGNAAWN